MLNYNQLRVFYHAAKNLSFTRAAQELFITQPAVTAQVKSLEAFWGLKLFKKRGRGIFLTEEGTVLYAHAVRVFEYEKEIENAINEMKELKRGILRVGTTKAYSRYFMPLLVRDFRERYPEVRIELNEGDSDDMIQSLLRLRIEVAIIGNPQQRRELTCIPFSREEIHLIMSPHHRLASRTQVGLHEIAAEPIIMKQRGSGTRAVVEDLFRRQRCVPNVLLETSNNELIKELAQRGEGLSFLVKAAIASEVGESKLVSVPLAGGNPFLEVSICYLAGEPLSPPAKAFVQILEDLAPREGPFEGLGAAVAEMSVRDGAKPPSARH